MTERAVSAVLAQDQDQAQKPIYFVSKVLQGPEVRYQVFRPVDRDVFVRDLNRQLRTPSH